MHATIYTFSKLLLHKISNFPSFQFNVLQQSSHVPTVGNVSDPLGYAMVKMTVGIIPMKETVKVKSSLVAHCSVFSYFCL